MKKGFLVLMAVITMTVCQADAALGMADIYLEGGPGEVSGYHFHWSYGDDTSLLTADESGSWTNAIFGVEVPIKRAKIAMELSNGKLALFDKGYDTSSLELKGGYAIIDKKKIHLDATLEYYQFSIKDHDFDSILAGIDFQFNFLKHFSVKSSLGLGDDGMVFKLKGIYMPSDYFGYSVGFRGYGFEEVTLNSNYECSGMDSFCAGILWRYGHVKPTN